MNFNIKTKRLLFYWVSSFIIATVMYYLLWLIMPSHRVFGSYYRMLMYQSAFPFQYIAIPCFFYGILATLFTGKFKKSSMKGRILITILIVLLTILLSSPFGGMLWHYHDMKFGYFPEHWISKMISNGFFMGIEMGWIIILLSFPYNIFGSIVCYFLIKKGTEVFRNKKKLFYK